jgi:predicted ATPase/DNA-binding CsgD family transcriptional regulator
MSSSDSRSDRPLVEPLSTREMEILAHMAEHRSNREIADVLVLSLNTVKWYARQIYGKLGVNGRRQAVSRARELGLIENGAPAPLPEHNLPAQLTPFVGRDEEVAEIGELMSEPTCRLLALTGPGGIGKTRLAIQAASLMRDTHRESFRDGVFFVPLASLSSSESFLAALAQAMGFSFYKGKESPEQQVNQYLHRKRMLMVLDNFEHLIDGESLRLLAEILTAAPGVRMIVTSRTRLNVRGEYLVSLGGMKVPETRSMARWQRPMERAAAYSAIQLFLHSARRIRQDFELSPDNVMHIARTCTLVQGMPLGIELAAAWVTVLEPEEIAAKIEESLDFLQTDASDVPDWQRSLRAAADSSWSLLTEERTAGGPAALCLPRRF